MSELGKASESTDMLLQALAESDEHRRLGRAERILWVSALCPQIGAVFGPLDTMSILNEARECFIEGHYIATVLLAMAFVEHTVMDELADSGLGRPGKFSLALDAAAKKQLFPDELLSRTRNLSLIRNAFTHRKRSDNPDNFGYRFQRRGVHPAKILEEDAKQFLALMYEYFRCTLKELRE
ncbi:hypothetical protein [Thiobacillus sp.]|uniref:hypothetical protein n=2 Tax=Thiobacillus TaxID=919 RepID=UPI0011DAFF03|nr:hypothetical protein [Thiobacillus sp.]MBC2758528.1 hypothetical protein [Thiobacillus sp.]TXH73785.1 MAG: hypothetical protein E6Q82_12770 [Thiobacillus sp.]